MSKTGDQYHKRVVMVSLLFFVIEMEMILHFAEDKMMITFLIKCFMDITTLILELNCHMKHFVKSLQDLFNWMWIKIT